MVKGEKINVILWSDIINIRFYVQWKSIVTNYQCFFYRACWTKAKWSFTWFPHGLTQGCQMRFVKDQSTRKKSCHNFFKKFMKNGAFLFLRHVLNCCGFWDNCMCSFVCVLQRKHLFQIRFLTKFWLYLLFNISNFFYWPLKVIVK